MENYFNYFTEIEEHFQRRRGSILLLSTLDWALIETWREAGVPLEAALRGIDAAFDKYDARKSRSRLRRVNGLAYCMQEVMMAVEDMKEAAIGAQPSGAKAAVAPGFEQERIAAHLEECAAQLDQAKLMQGLANETARELAARYAAGPAIALRAAKDAIDRGLDADLDTGLEIERLNFAGLFGTEDARTGMQSLLENGPGKASFSGS